MSGSSGGNTDMEAERGSPTGTPRWVKVFGIFALLVIVLFVVLLLTGRGGGHGPVRHTPGSDPSRGHSGSPAGLTHP